MYTVGHKNGAPFIIACSYVSFSHKTHRKKTNWRKRQHEFFLRQTIRRALVVLRSDIHWLRELLNFGLSRSMVMLECIEFGCVHKIYRLNRIVRIPPVCKLVTETGLIWFASLPDVIRSTIGYHSNSWAFCSRCKATGQPLKQETSFSYVFSDGLYYSA